MRNSLIWFGLQENIAALRKLNVDFKGLFVGPYSDNIIYLK